MSEWIIQRDMHSSTEKPLYLAWEGRDERVWVTDPRCADRIRWEIAAAREARLLTEIMGEPCVVVSLRSLLDAEERERRRAAEAVPVDHTARVLVSGQTEAERPDYREINPATGQQKDYVVLSPDERAKGFVRPVRRTYIHLPCRTTTTMSQQIAETYARSPEFYGGTFCCACRQHFPLDQFRWEGTDEVVGS